MKYAIITDLHFGARKNDNFLMKKQIAWLDSFIENIKRLNIGTVINLGDTFDDRVSINIKTLNVFKELFFDKLNDLGIESYHILGNHDVYYKDNNSVNIMSLVLASMNSDKFHLIEDTPLQIPNSPFVLCSWINEKNVYNIRNDLEKLKSNKKYLLGHFQIKGFQVLNGICKDGQDRSDFKGWKKVLSGHFHLPSEDDNIWYIGNPFYLNWGDYNAKKGYLIYDDETDTFEHIETDDKVYNVLNLEDIDVSNIPVLKEQIIRVFVNGIEDNEAKLKMVLDKLALYDNKVEVIENIDIDNTTIDVSMKKNHDANSKEFLEDVIEELGIERESDVKQYILKKLMT